MPRLPLVLPCLLWLTAACGDFEPRPRAEPSRGGTAIIASSSDLQTLNPLVVEDETTADFLEHALFLTLVRLDEQLEYTPNLAEAWQVSGDSIVQFRLRDDVRWHDGTPTTAHDVAFTFERATDPATASIAATDFGGWSSPVVVDSYTVRFHVRPGPDALLGWAELPIVPRHLLDTVPPEATRRSTFGRKPVGNGPFRFVSARENDRTVVEANPDFPDGLGGPPYLDRVVWRVVPESQAQLTELLTGNAHLMMAPRAEQAERISHADVARLIEAPSMVYAFIGWNAARRPFDDVRVRRAMSLAIDRRAIIDGLRGGRGSVAIGPVPEGHWAYDETLEPLPYDTAQAIRLLEDAGWLDRNGDGVREDARGQALVFRLLIPAGVDFSRDVAEVVRADLAEIGARVETRVLEAATLFADITAPEKRFEAVLLSLAGDVRMELRDAFHSQHIGGPFQLSSYASPHADSLLDAIAAAQTRDEAVPHWHALQQRLRDEAPWTFLYYAPTLRAASTRLRGVEVDLRGTFITLPRWWLAPES